MKYIIVVWASWRDLVLEVNNYINMGYTPIWWVAVSIEKGKVYYFQSMIINLIN